MLAYLFVLFAVVFRLLLKASALNFAPVAASLLFFGSRMPRRQAWVPVAALMLSDMVLTLHVYGYPLRADQAVTWAWYLAIVLLGSLLQGRAGVPAHCRRFAGGVGVVFPAEQLGGVGGLGDVSADAQWSAGLLHCGDSVLPQHRGLGPAVHRRVLRRSGSGGNAERQSGPLALCIALTAGQAFSLAAGAPAPPRTFGRRSMRKHRESRTSVRLFAFYPSFFSREAGEIQQVSFAPASRLMVRASTNSRSESRFR